MAVGFQAEIHPIAEPNLKRIVPICLNGGKFEKRSNVALRISNAGTLIVGSSTNMGC